MRRRPIVLCCVLILLQVLAWRSDAQGAGRSPASPPAYRVETAGFDASEADIRAVLDSAGRELWQFFPDYTIEPIVVTRGHNGPITLFQRNDRGEIVVRLDTGKTFWSQYSYQFAHELCHVLCGFREGYEGNKWFEETLCETASLYVMRAMARSWKESPPGANWKDYRDSLRDYADDVVRKREKVHEIYASGLRGFYLAHKAELEKEPCLRDLNGAMAIVFLQLFEERPQRWEAVRWLNSTRAPEGETLAAYLQRWHDAAPARRQSFVKGVADMYGVSIRSNAPAEPLASPETAAPRRPGPSPVAEARDERSMPRYRIEADGFKASREDIQAVLDSAGRELWRHFPGYRIEPFVVLRGHEGPTVLYGRNPQGEIVVKLDTEGTSWCQYAYQFSYLFAEILCGFDEKSVGNKWFETSICDAASLFALEQMSRSWERDPPYPNWKEYRHALADYVQSAMGRRRKFEPQGLKEFYEKHRQELARGTDTRPLSQAVAVVLLKLFEEQPEHWEAVRWLNSSPSPAGEPFGKYLQRWYDAVPQKHQPLVRKIGDLFGVSIKRT